jgi:PAS domain S-box-containing protein
MFFLFLPGLVDTPLPFPGPQNMDRRPVHLKPGPYVWLNTQMIMRPPAPDAEILLGSLYNGVVAINEEGVIVCFNETAERLFDVSSADALGCHVLDVLPKTGGKLLDCLKTGVTLKGEKLGWGEGTLVSNISPVSPEGKIIGAISVFQDISDIEAVSRELDLFKDMKKWLDIIIDSSYDGLWICDDKGKVIRINEASERINGVKAAEVLGRSMEDLVKEGWFDKSVTLEVLRHKTAVTIIQNVRGGKRVLVTGSPIIGEDGQITFVVTNDRDITELYQLHEELQEIQTLAKGYVTTLSRLEMKEIGTSNLVFHSEAIKRVLDMARRVAGVDSAVLLLGESGAGKGAIAKLIHRHSDRTRGPFVRVDCASIPAALFESELFGYERGAFTGARMEGKAGQFELADKGSLFLDEIAEIPFASQSKLLRFLEDHEFVRVGGTKARSINVRIIAATNRDLEKMVASGRFRKDLYYRLNVVPIRIPPLRERGDDIVPLIHHFLNKFNRSGKKRKTFSPDAIEVLCHYGYPGNIRELANIIERSVVVTEGDRIEVSDLPSSVTGAGGAAVHQGLLNPDVPLKEAIQRFERLVVEMAVKKYGSQEDAARALDVHQSTISRKMRG